MLKANVTITTSFDKDREYAKVWEDRDFEEFFIPEGKYVDNLVKILDSKGNVGDGLIIQYIIEVEKGE